MVNSAALRHDLAAWRFTVWVKPIADIRRERLLLLVEHFRGYAGLNAALGRLSRDATLNQIAVQSPDSKTGRPRSMGTRLARKIEEHLGLPNGWMDSDPEHNPAPVRASIGRHAVAPIPIAAARRRRDRARWPFAAPWDRYLALDPEQREALDRIVTATIDGFSPGSSGNKSRAG